MPARVDLGDIEDAKRAIARMIRSSLFLASLRTVMAAKADGKWPRLPVTVYEEERASHLVFPMAELVGYSTRFSEDDVIKQAEHTIGVRWTSVDRTEATVTRDVERLVRATTDMLWMSRLDSQVTSGPVRVLEEDYSPLAPSTFSDNPYVKSGIVMVAVPTWRD